MATDSTGPDSPRPDSQPLATLIVLHYGNPDLTDACLRSIESNTPEELYKLILVDNWSVGGEIYDPPTARNLDRLVRNEVNLGWSKSNNQAAKYAHTPILVFMNNDTEVESGWLTELLSAFDDPEVAVAGARLHYPNGGIQHSGIIINRHHGGVAAENRHDEHPTEDVDGVTGACLAVRRHVFDQVGGFDERYYNGNDDVAFCIAVRESNWRIRYVQSSRVLHHESASGSERWVKCHENVRLLNEQWGLQ